MNITIVVISIAVIMLIISITNGVTSVVVASFNIALWSFLQLLYWKCSRSFSPKLKPNKVGISL